MERAGPKRPARPMPAGAGTLGRLPTGPGQATGPQPSPRAGAPWLRRPLALPGMAAGSPPGRQALLLLGFLAAGVAATMPRALYLAGELPASRDSASYVWGFWWMARQVTRLGNPWFTRYMAAPVGVDLGFHTLMPLPGLVMTPVTLAFGPSFAYNLLVILMPGLLCYAAYRAARLWLRSGPGAVAAGAFFGLSAMLTQQAWYHLNIAAGALFLPLALTASVRLRRDPRPVRGLVLGLVMGAAVLTDQEFAVLAAIVTGLALVPWLAWRPGWAKTSAAGLAVLAGAVIAAPQILAMVAEINVGGLSIPPATLAVSYKQYGIGLPGMFTPTTRVALFGLSALAGPALHSRDNEGLPMFGTMLTVLALAGLAAARRRGSAWKLAGLWAGCAVLALGTSLWIGRHQYLPLAQTWHGVRVSLLMPYTWFVRIPGLSSFREADRLAILGLLPATLLAGAAVDWICHHVRPRRAMVAVLTTVGLLAGLEAGWAGWVPGMPRVGVMAAGYPGVDRAIAADHSGSVVLDIPFGLRGGIPVWGVPFFPQAQVMATEDGHPRSIAYTARVPGNTIEAMQDHPFYWYLNQVEHEVQRKCPWERDGCGAIPGAAGVAPWGTSVTALNVTPAELAAARRDAARMNVRWAVIWKRNISEADFIIPYLKATGFRFAYCYPRAGRRRVLVYRRGGPPGRASC
jgi:hypothetical protein